MAKRTHTLKSLAARQSFSVRKEYLQEDLLQSIDASTPSHDEASISKEQDTDFKGNTLLGAFQSHLTKAAHFLELEISDLQAWVEGRQEIPMKVKLSLLRLIITHKLDPFLEEVVFTQYEKQPWEAMITVDGWSKIANQCSTFSGIYFCQSVEENTDHIPLWIECTIYRTDRHTPITVREYFDEVRGNSEPWVKMPRRMLRHRAFQQCARIALG